MSRTPSWASVSVRVSPSWRFNCAKASLGNTTPSELPTFRTLTSTFIEINVVTFVITSKRKAASRNVGGFLGSAVPAQPWLDDETPLAFTATRRSTHATSPALVRQNVRPNSPCCLGRGSNHPHLPYVESPKYCLYSRTDPTSNVCRRFADVAFGCRARRYCRRGDSDSV